MSNDRIGNTHISNDSLVGDLDRSIAFYTRLMGMTVNDSHANRLAA